MILLHLGFSIQLELWPFRLMTPLLPTSFLTQHTPSCDCTMYIHILRSQCARPIFEFLDLVLTALPLSYHHPLLTLLILTLFNLKILFRHILVKILTTINYLILTLSMCFSTTILGSKKKRLFRILRQGLVNVNCVNGRKIQSV